MPNSLDLGQTAVWFKNPGPDNDVVLSSRVRLGRNLTGFPFPQTMTLEQETRARDQILGAFRNLDPATGYAPYILDEMKLLDVKLLLERNIITQEYSLGKNKAVVFDPTGGVSVMINETDHLKMAGIEGGNRLKEVWQAVDRLDTALEEKLDYAVSLEWGYLGPFITGIGTQMRASLMLHLPALVFTALISKAVKTIASVGLSIKGFFADGDESLGDIYQISNQISLGMPEKEIIENLEAIVLQLVNYERRAREEMLEKEPVAVKDRVGRALGTLLYAGTIASREAISLLSLIRLGISLGMIKGTSYETVTALLFQSQKYHIQSVLGNNEEVDAKQIDYMRARLIRQTLTGVQMSGGE